MRRFAPSFAVRRAARWWSLLALALAVPAAAQASHRVTLVIPEVESLAITSGPIRMTFATPPPGEPVAAVTDATGTYAVAVNTAGSKITGVLDADDGRFRLSVRLAPPPGARSVGAVGLGETARDVVADVGRVAASGLTVVYTASVSGAAPPPGTRATWAVTFTVTTQ